MDEKVVNPSPRRKIIHEHGEPFGADIRVYALEEIVAEKLRAILQHVAKLEERGWIFPTSVTFYGRSARCAESIPTVPMISSRNKCSVMLRRRGISG